MKKLLSILLAFSLSMGLMAGQEELVKSEKVTTLQKVKKVLTSKPAKVVGGVALVVVVGYVGFLIGQTRPRRQSVKALLDRHFAAAQRRCIAYDEDSAKKADEDELKALFPLIDQLRGALGMPYKFTYIWGTVARTELPGIEIGFDLHGEQKIEQIRHAVSRLVPPGYKVLYAINRLIIIPDNIDDQCYRNYYGIS